MRVNLECQVKGVCLVKDPYIGHKRKLAAARYNLLTKYMTTLDIKGTVVTPLQISEAYALE